MTTTDIPDDEETVIVNGWFLSKDVIEFVFQDTSSEEEVGNEWLQVNLQALQEDPSSLQEPANIMQIQICDEKGANFPVKIAGINVITLYTTGVNMSYMSIACYRKLKDPLP